MTRSSNIRLKRMAIAQAFASLAGATVFETKALGPARARAVRVRDTVPQSGFSDSRAWRTLNSDCNKLADVESREKQILGL